MTTPVKADLEQLKQDVERKFQEMRAALHMREKLLLRQIDVIEQQIGRANSSISGPPDCATGAGIKFEADQEAVLLASIRSFGRFQLDNMNLALQDVYLQHEDYIAPTNDHETMYKCLMQNAIGSSAANSANNNNNLTDDNDLGGGTAIVVDFSKNKSLIEHNAKHMNESIINITLQEAKELIKKAKVKRDTAIPPLNLEELDDEFESSIAEAVSSLAQETPASLGAKPKAKKSRFKPKITINNCNGTINLRNIASLTINCASEEAVSADIPVIDDEDGSDVVSTTRGSKKSAKKSKSSKSSATGPPALPESASTTPTSSSNYSSTTSSRSQSKKLSKTSKGKVQQQQQQKPQTKSISLSKSLTTIRQPAKGSQSYAMVVSPDEPNSLEDDHEDEDVEVEDDDDGCQSEEIVPTCEFYNRLLNEIKNSLREKPRRIYEPTTTVSSSTYNSRDDTDTSAAPQGQPQDTGVTTTTNSTSNSGSSSTSLVATSSSSADGGPGAQQGKRLVLKNFENLKIILEANSGDEDSFHPVQIEQWLAEIITEADLEPMQNTEILEHSKIHNETL